MSGSPDDSITYTHYKTNAKTKKGTDLSTREDLYFIYDHNIRKPLKNIDIDLEYDKIELFARLGMTTIPIPGLCIGGNDGFIDLKIAIAGNSVKIETDKNQKQKEIK